MALPGAMGFSTGALVLAATLAGTAASHAAVTISTAATSNMSCASGVCTPTAANAVLNVTDLENMLASANLTVNTGGATATDIDVAAPITWVGAFGLTLDAYHSIAVASPVADNGTASFTLLTDDGGTGGTLSFGTGGSIAFLGTSNALTINGNAYTLVGNIATLAGDVAANPSGFYALANNYDASQDGTYSNCPVNSTLTGTLEGLGNTISNLTIVAKGKRHFRPSAAFVAYVSGVLENLRLTAIHYQIRGKDTAAGGLALVNEGTLFGDMVQGTIDAHAEYAGGLVEGNNGTIVGSSANVRVTGSGLVGGLAAVNNGSISLSNAGGAVSGFLVGGLVAYNYDAIDQSFSTGSVEGGTAGGFAAYNYGARYPAPTISNSYATGNVKYGGGFVYEVETNVGDELESSYSTGTVGKGGGGFECNWDGPDEVADDYWNTTTSGTKHGTCGVNVPGITGLTTKQLRSGLPSGFDPTIWTQNPTINHGFPYLIANPPQ
jgi:GLUG motif-containing protein